MEDEIIRKYVRDFNGLLREMGKVTCQPELVVGENAVIFLFGRIFRYLNFGDILIGHEKALDSKLDAWAWQERNNKEIIIEFEARSKNFEKDKHDPNKCDLIVCWEDNWKEHPSNIDVLELKRFWEKAQRKSK